MLSIEDSFKANSEGELLGSRYDSTNNIKVDIPGLNSKLNTKVHSYYVD